MRWFTERSPSHNGEPEVRQAAPERPVVDIVGECEAFLSGGYAEWLAARGETLPTWALLNALAHSAPDRLGHAGEVALSMHPSAGASDWEDNFRELRAGLADLGEIDPALLHYLQITVLVPLELDIVRALVPPTLEVALSRAREAIGTAWG